MSSQNEFTYIEVKNYPALPDIEIGEVKDFVKLANENAIKNIFKIKKKDKLDFYFQAAGIVYRIDSKGFRTLKDMREAQNKNFPTAREYYEADIKGVKTYEQYVTFKETGIDNKEDYEAARKAGFEDGFKKFKTNYEKYLNGAHTSILPFDINNPVKIHKYALQKGIKTYDEFEKIYNAGFSDSLTYNEAQSKGFKEADAYYDAIKKGFSDPDEYNEAMKLHIDTKKEYDEYRYLKDLNEHRHYTFDQLQLLIALSNRDNGEIISLAEIKKMLQSVQEKLKKSVGASEHKITPRWYSKSIEQEKQLIDFLKNNEELKKFGFYNVSSKSFEIFRASAAKIYVDGSNVAHNGKPKPEVKNIKLVIKELKFRKFKSIVVLVDANLRYKLQYPFQLKELEGECEYHEVPSKTAADEFLIAAIKKEKCLVVSNDEFKDWKEKDKWAKNKIDSIRIPFRVIKGDIVILKGLEEIRETLIEQ